MSMKNNKFLQLSTLLLFCCSCGNLWSVDNLSVASVSAVGVIKGWSVGTATVKAKTSEIEATATVTVEAGYSNPVSNNNLPDPSVIKADDGYFYLYATESVRNVPIMRSQDLTSWELVVTCFTDDTRPAWVIGGGIWATDIQRINGKYVLYYAMSIWGGEWNCGIGVAVADKPEGPFTNAGPYLGTSNAGMLFRSIDIGVQNSIDPCYVEDEGKKYIIWGSHKGIYIVELAGDGMSVREGASAQHIAGKPNDIGFEGAQVHRRGEYYYLFASWGTCCDGANSTYKTVVGRSKSIFGPYLTRDSKSMSDNYYEVVIQGNERFVGVGHSSALITDNAGNDWILYHGYIRSDPGKGRVLFLDKIIWDDNWPTVANGTPSSVSPIPKF